MPRDDRPPYVTCSLEDWAVAKANYERLKTDAAWAMQARFRVAAVAAAIANGAAIPALLALEHRTYIESKNYRPRAVASSEPRPAGDILGARTWPGEKTEPNAMPQSDFAWLDDIFPKKPGIPGVPR